MATGENQELSASSLFERISRKRIHPGHFFLATSLPFNYWAYKGFNQPLEDLVQTVLKERTNGRVKIRDIKGAEEDVRRAVASAVASRALRVATCTSVGTFGLVAAGCFYWSGCQTMGEAIEITQGWAHSRRKDLDRFIGTQGRIDRSHPEVMAVKGMSEEEEMQYISDKYLPDEEWDVKTKEA